MLETIKQIFQFLLSDLATQIAALPDREFYGIVIVLGLFALGALSLGFYYLRRIKQIQTMPTSKIRSAAQGYVELEGTQHCLKHHTLTSPLSNAPCTWYSVKLEGLERRYRNGKLESFWRQLNVAQSEHFFLLKDGTGTCVVNPIGATLLGGHKTIWHGATPVPGSYKRGWFTPKKYRYTELLLKPDTSLYALGMFHTVGNLTDASPMETQVNNLIKHWEKSYDKLLAEFDTNKNGKLDDDEKTELVKAAEKVLIKRALGQRSEDPTQVHILSKHGILKRPFILSTQSERSIVFKAKTQAGLFIGIFLLLGAYTLYLMTI